jgi:AcrR family transcriptional regulator
MNTIPLTILDDPDGTGRMERADAAANRVLVLQTAERLFEEHGVAAVTMADIAQAAGIGKGTLYRRFANKAELSLALMDDQMAEFQNGMLEDMRLMTARGEAYVDQLRHYLTRLVVFADRHSPLLCEVERSGLLLAMAHPELPHLWHSMTVAALLRVAQRQGEIDAGLDAEFLAETLLAAVHVDSLRYQRDVRGFSTERIINGLDGLLAALAID